VQPRLRLQVRPHLAVDQHHVAEVLADPGDAGNVADRVPEGAVVVELAVLDHQRDLVAAAGEPGRVRLRAGVVGVPDDVGGGEPGEDVQPGNPVDVIVEPHQPGR